MIRRLARPMLATVFVIDGVETLRNPQAHVADAAPLVEKTAPVVEKGEQAVNERVSATVPPVPKDTETLVKALAGVKIGAGVLFALGKAPRISALALTASHLPSTVSRHAFWSESDPAARSRKTTGLATDVALLGALMLASVDTAGQPGIAWRAGKARNTVAAKLPGAKAESAAAGAAITGAAHNVADQARGVAGTVRDRAPEVAEQVRGQATDLADVVRATAPTVVARLRDRAAVAKEQAAPFAAQVREQASAAAHVAAEQAGPLATEVRDRAGTAAHVAADQAADARVRAASARDAAVARAEKVDTKDARKAAENARKAAKARKKTVEKKASKQATNARKKSDELRVKAARVIRP